VRINAVSIKAAGAVASVQRFCTALFPGLVNT
jgi:hypothetical protein